MVIGYVPPTSEAEAREVLDRAIASGAMPLKCVEACKSSLPLRCWNKYPLWGVLEGKIYAGYGAHRPRSVVYTIDKVRELFPLPNEVNQQEEKVMPNNITHVLNKEFEERVKVLETVINMQRKVMYEGYLLEYYIMDGWVGLTTLEDSIKMLNSATLNLDTMESLTGNYRVVKAPSKPKPVYMVIRVPHADGKERVTQLLTYKDSDSAINSMRTGDAGAHKDCDCGYVLLTILENEIIQATIKNI